MSVKCETCAVNPFKYTCPGCLIKTCSLPCVRQHKEATGCTGQRDKTKFVRKDEFTELDFLNDYKFLEQSSQIIDSAKRQAEILDTNAGPNSTSYSGFFENLRKFVYSEFSITLNLMPMQATRHLANKTRFNRASKIVSWSFEFIFHLSNRPTTGSSHLLKLSTKKNLFSSKETLRNTLTRFYDKYKSELFEVPSAQLKKKFDTSMENSSQASIIALYTEFNSFFQSQDFSDLNLLFEVADYESRRKYFIKFDDLEQKLEEALRSKTILEYPTFYVVKTADLGSYHIASSPSIEAIRTKNEHVEPTQKRSEFRGPTGNLEDGECNTESDECQENDDILDKIDQEVNCSKRLIADCGDNASNKKLKASPNGSLSEEGELDDSN